MCSLDTDKSRRTTSQNIWAGTACPLNVFVNFNATSSTTSDPFRRGFLLRIKGAEKRNRPHPFRAGVRGASRLRPYTPSRHGALILYESSVSSILCDVLIITQLRSSKMFPYCRYVPVLLRCCTSDNDRSTRSIWDSVLQVNRNYKNLLSALRRKGQRCGNIPQQHAQP
jgi:hypothetical protein